MTSLRALEDQINVETEACMNADKGVFGNMVFRRKESFRPKCEEGIRYKYREELAALQAQENTVNDATNNAYLQLGGANTKIYIVAAVGLAIIISIIYVLKNN